MGEFTRMVQKDYGVQKKANNYEKSSSQKHPRTDTVS
jgi:hypothetical protein